MDIEKIQNPLSVRTEEDGPKLMPRKSDLFRPSHDLSPTDPAPPNRILFEAISSAREEDPPEISTMSSSGLITAQDTPRGILPPILVPSGSGTGLGAGLGLGAFAAYGQDYLSRQQTGGSGGGSGRPRGNTIAEADIANIFENIPRNVYNPPDDFLRNPRPIHSHVRTGSSSSLPCGRLGRSTRTVVSDADDVYRLHGTDGRSTSGQDWYSASSRYGADTPPPHRGSESPAQRSYGQQFPSTPGPSGPPSRRSTDESNYASPPTTMSDQGGSYFSQHSMRYPVSPMSASATRDPGGRRDSVSASHPYLVKSRRPSLGEAINLGPGSGYTRARSPLGSLTQRVPGAMQIDSGPGEDGMPRRDLDDTIVRAQVKQQRIESEQRRRDEMRQGFQKLMDVLPANTQKTKTVTLDRAVHHITGLEAVNRDLQRNVQSLLEENEHLRKTNMMLVQAQARRLGINEPEGNTAGFHFESDFGRRS